MANTPWKSKNWYVSQWNYENEVTKDFKFAKNIKVHDITLRDGEQQTGIIMTKDDKIRIAEGLAEAGVHRIEAGMPIVSPSDAEAIKEIVKRNLGPQIFAFSRCMKEDVQRAIDTGVNGVVMEIPSSQHMVDLAYKWPMEKAIETSIEATKFARDNGLEVVFFPIDFSRSEMTWVLNLIERVATEGHMDALALVDTFGVVSPHAMQYFVRQVKKRINKRLEAHFHQDFGMGVANTIMALAEGVEVMHTTVLGVGERARNTPMEETVMALRDVRRGRRARLHQAHFACQPGRKSPGLPCLRTNRSSASPYQEIRLSRTGKNCGEYAANSSALERRGQPPPSGDGQGSGIDSSDIGSNKWALKRRRRSLDDRGGQEVSLNSKRL